MERFCRTAFLATDESGKDALSSELADFLLQRLKLEPEFHTGVGNLVAELRAAGHDLTSFGQASDIELWCPDGEQTAPGIVVMFRPDRVEVEWSRHRLLWW